jgi:flagellar biosynthetic protein FliS
MAKLRELVKRRIAIQQISESTCQRLGRHILQGAQIPLVKQVVRLANCVADFERALAGFDCDDPADLNMTVNNNLQRASDIVRELDCALDVDKGGDLALTLHRLYDYFQGHIHASNLKKQRAGIEEVIQHLNVLRDAWATMLRGEGSDAVMGAVPLEALATAGAGF